MLVISDRQTQLAIDAMFKQVREWEKKVIHYANTFDRFQDVERDKKDGQYYEIMRKACDELDSEMELAQVIERYHAHKRATDRLLFWMNEVQSLVRLQLEDATDPTRFYFVMYRREVDMSDDHSFVELKQDAEILSGRVDWCMNGGLINHGTVEEPRWSVHT